MNCMDSTNFVLHAKSNQFYWEGTANYPLKHFLTEKRITRLVKVFAVEESRYLLLNEGSYTISIDENKEVESFCIFLKMDLQRKF